MTVYAEKQETRKTDFFENKGEKKMKKLCCENCAHFREGYCRYWYQKIQDSSKASTCETYAEAKPLNKGLQIRRNKLNKKIQKRAEIKPEQENLVCFVDFSVKVIEKMGGKYRKPTRTEKGSGLQIKNKIYMEDGTYKFVNRSTLKVTKQYPDIPEWANEYLKNLYQKSINQSITSTEPKDEHDADITPSVQ